MELFGVNGNKSVRVNNRKDFKKINSGDFKSSLNDSEEVKTDVHGVSLSNSINPFLVLNQVDESDLDREIVIEQSNDILKLLNEIRYGLINGEFDSHHIISLKDLLKSKLFSTKDIELNKVIDEILLRAEVELAKLEKNLL